MQNDKANIEAKAKEKFFSLYFGQYVYHSLQFQSGVKFMVNGLYLYPEYVAKGYLALRSVKQLTRDHIEIIAKLYGWVEIKKTDPVRYEERLLQYQIDLPCICIDGFKHQHLSFVFDLLREWGYLIPFTTLTSGEVKTYSEEEILALDWARLEK